VFHPRDRCFHNEEDSCIHWKSNEGRRKLTPKKILAVAWIRGSRKIGTPQLTCNNKFTETMCRILPLDRALSNKSAPLREWIPLASDTSNWQAYIGNYFEHCQKADPLKDPSTSTYEVEDGDEAE